MGGVPPKTILRVACLQINAGCDPEKNLTAVRRKLALALRLHPHLVAFPENFAARGPAEDLPYLASQVTPKVIREFQNWCRRERVALLLGSLIESSPSKNKFYNTSILISEKGRIAARYRKMHLFDVKLPKLSVQESRHVARGSQVVTGKIWGVRAGLAICYDLRFPELFRNLTERGSRVIFVPSNFTEKTGKAHWEILLRARAIENQVFIVAPAQAGTHPATGIRSFGTSLIVNPWGSVVARAGRREEKILCADLNLKRQEELRKSFPVLKHRRSLS